MTNFEKYRDEILAIVEQNDSVAIVHGLPQRCTGTSCSCCDFYCAENCNYMVTRWLYADFQPFKRGERVIVEKEDGSRLRRYFAEQKGDQISVLPMAATNGVLAEALLLIQQNVLKHIKKRRAQNDKF